MIDYDAWLTLRLTPDIGRMRFHRLVEAFGSPQAALGASARSLERIPGMDRTASGNVVRHRDLVDLGREKDLLEKHEARLLALHDPAYPVNLRNSYLPPPLIYIRGELEPDDRFAISIVGSRRSTAVGRAATDGLVREFVGAGIMIVSGMAAGIDTAAHRAAIRHGGRTVAVLAHGLAKCFPAENRGLMDEIAQNGAAITEYPMDDPPAPINFPERNRIIAAMGLGTVVAEAPRRSGALITADMTLEENRGLYALPSDISRKTGEGGNELIRQGAARLVTCAADVLEDLHGQLRGLLREAESERVEIVPIEERLTPEERAIYACLTDGPIGIDEIGRRVPELTTGRLATLLLALEMKKTIRQLPGKVFAVRT